MTDKEYKSPLEKVFQYGLLVFVDSLWKQQCCPSV